MSHDQLVNASTECSKEFVIANTHRAKYGVITARRTDLMGNSDIHREISHPIGFWHWKQIWMVTQTPGDNAGSRTWRAHYKNRFIYFIVHFTVILLRDILRATFSGFLVRPRLSHCQISRSSRISKIGDCLLAYTRRSQDRFTRTSLR